MTHVAIDFDAVCRSLGLTKLAMSDSMYGGTCPLCHRERSFFVWLDRRPIRAVCMDGCKISLTIRDNGRPWVPDQTEARKNVD